MVLRRNLLCTILPTRKFFAKVDLETYKSYCVVIVQTTQHEIGVLMIFAEVKDATASFAWAIYAGLIDT